MGNGLELTLQLALKQKPAAFSATCPSRGIIPEMLAGALNAARLYGHSQILDFCRSSCSSDQWDNVDEAELKTILDIIQGMQLKEGEIEFSVTPDSPEERSTGRFCRIDLRLKK